MDDVTRLCAYEYCQVEVSGSKLRRYCSPLCGERARRGFVPPPGTCDTCGGPVGDVPQTRYCSQKCKSRAYYLTHVEDERRRAEENRAARPGYYRSYSASYRQANRDRVNAEHRARYLADPQPYKDARALRRAREKATADSIGLPSAEWARIVRRHDGRCAYCGNRDVLTVEHVLPVSKGGRHAPANIVPACDPCNRRKSNKYLMAWRIEMSRGLNGYVVPTLLLPAVLRREALRAVAA